MTDWDRHYICGTLRQSAGTGGIPAPTAPLTNANPYNYIDELGLWMGRVLGLMAIVTLVMWMLP